MAGLILLSFHGGHNEEHKEELDRRKGMLRSIDRRPYARWQACCRCFVE